MSENLIKSITVHKCPKCQEEIFVESQMTPPVVGSLFTVSDVETAKKDCLARVETLAIDEEKKAGARKWLADEDTVFGPNEVESIIISLLKPQE